MYTISLEFFVNLKFAANHDNNAPTPKGV